VRVPSDPSHFREQACKSPSFCILLISVVHLRPSLAAAPFGPPITHFPCPACLGRHIYSFRAFARLLTLTHQGMGAQVFVLPYLDSIAGFTVLFAVVTAISAWIATASARLSYLGVQLALAFYLKKPAGVRHPDFALRRPRSCLRSPARTGVHGSVL
jgi:hypothetical protein